MKMSQANTLRCTHCRSRSSSSVLFPARSSAVSLARATGVLAAPQNCTPHQLIPLVTDITSKARSSSRVDLSCFTRTRTRSSDGAE
jgi:hypothetical protein